MPSFRTWAQSHPLPETHQPLTTSVIPALLGSIARISTALRHRHHISPTDGNTLNAFGDAQLNVDVLAEKILRDALAACPAVCTASSEEDPIERPVRDTPTKDETLHQSKASQDTPSSSSTSYTVAFDPLDGSSIIGPNWSVGTIIGIWHGTTALSQDPSTKQIASLLGVYGPRTTAFVAIRIPGQEPLCVEVGIPPAEASGGQSNQEEDDFPVIRDCVRLASSPASAGETRYFAPANLRAAADDARYWALVERYIRGGYTLRYSGGLVPDVVHALVKGRGVYVSPVTARSKAKLRRLYELLPVALVVECAGGRAVDSAEGTDVLARAVEGCDERGGLVCGNGDEVEFAMATLGSEK
ncbi:hypothetical protein E4U19_007592 [Claviceps sp. Clav32 group G5]|nr:hypothetical protein E4U19_007592 [Claviceps sp. Clav32 group G5]KAG6033929.1 hypothetical protein E4U40_004698 [Claviceps sp. LM458 group G5]KAG6045746.1 hypothetical protein E4U39_001981 [Claviceps sp. Clav50 group G5]